MTTDIQPDQGDPLDQFQAALRRENEQIEPSDALVERVAQRIDAEGDRADQYRVVIPPRGFAVHARRFALPVAAMLAIGIIGSLLRFPQSQPVPNPIATADRGSKVPVPSADPPLRESASVVMTGDKPTIVRELPTERPDVTIVWVYDVVHPEPPADSETSPVGALPTPKSTSTGTHS